MPNMMTIFSLHHHTYLMVQRLTLAGILPQEEQTMAMRCLEAISGMTSRPFEIKREIWEPKFRQTSQPQGQGGIAEQYRIFLTESSSGHSLEVEEVPEAARNIKVISQTVLIAQISVGIEYLPQFMQDIGYEKKSSYIMRGFEFVLHGSVLVHLFHLFDGSDQPLEKFQQYAVRASVDVESVTDLNAVEQATQLLNMTQQELRGVLSLKTPSRGAFNTRIPRVMV